MLNSITYTPCLCFQRFTHTQNTHLPRTLIWFLSLSPWQPSFDAEYVRWPTEFFRKSRCCINWFQISAENIFAALWVCAKEHRWTVSRWTISHQSQDPYGESKLCDCYIFKTKGSGRSAPRWFWQERCWISERAMSLVKWSAKVAL